MSNTGESPGTAGGLPKKKLFWDEMFQSTCPRGARPWAVLIAPDPARFQSTCPRGARLYGSTRTERSRKFQSTCPRGARLPRCPGLAGCVSGFNPRARVGHDSLLLIKKGVRHVSIHVPAWGTTIGSCKCTPLYVVFQSTCPRGARRSLASDMLFWSSVSIHVPAWGTTCRVPILFGKCLVSIHVPAWGTTGSTN